MMKVGIYARLSREDENDSIKNQVSSIKSFVNKMDGIIVETYIDNGESSYSLDREAMSKAMLDISKRKIEALVVKDLDRLTRSMRDWYYLCDVLRDNKVQLISTTEGIVKIDKLNPYGDIGTRIKGIVNEEELLKTIRKMREGRKQKASRGYTISNNSIMGYDKINKNELKINEDEAKIIKLIFNKFIEFRSYVKVAKTLNEMGIKTKRGAEFSHHSIRYILQNPLYIGKIRYGVRQNTEEAFTVEGHHEPIITEEAFEKVQKLIPKSKHMFKESKYNDIIFYNVYCSKCGGRYYSHSSNVKRKEKTHRYVKYYCYNNRIKGTCISGIVNQNKLEKALINYLRYIELRESIDLNTNKDLLEQYEILKNKIKEIDKKIENLVDLRISGTIDMKIYEKKNKELNNEKQGIISSLESIQKEVDEISNNKNSRKIAKVVHENYLKLKDEDKKEFINRFIEAIYIDVTKKGNINDISIKSILFK